jgi:hypothetical protein
MDPAVPAPWLRLIVTGPTGGCRQMCTRFFTRRRKPSARSYPPLLQLSVSLVHLSVS